MARRRILLQLAQHRPAEHVRQEDVERDRGRPVFARQRQRIRAAHGDEHLEAVFVREIDHHARIMRIVLDDQEHIVAGRDLVAVVLHLFRRRFAEKRRRECRWRATVSLRLAQPGRRAPTYVSGRIERERAADARRAAQLDFAAEQIGKLAADREPETRAAVLAAGAGIRLLEGLEDDPLLLRRDADAGIGDLEGDDRRRVLQRRVIGAPALAAGNTRRLTPPWAVNLKAFDRRFLRTCCRRLEFGDDAALELGRSRTRRTAGGSPPRAGTAAPSRPAGCRRGSPRHRPKPCRIRSSTGRGCR